MKKQLNEFSVGDVVTNHIGDVFEIKAINKTGSVKVYVIQTDGYYVDVVGNHINPNKTYTVIIPNEYEFELVTPEKTDRKNLNEFSVGDVVTNDVGEVFEIKAINKTGSVKIFVKETMNTYCDVYGNDVNKVGKIYTVNIENHVWRLVSENNSLEQEILSYESQIKELQNKISKAKELIEKKKYPEISVGEMYLFTEYGHGILSGNEWVGIVVAVDSDGDEFVAVDSYFDIHESSPTNFKSIVHITTPKEKKMADYVTKFYNEKYNV